MNDDEELKKIIEETIGNNDPFWNEPVYKVVKKICDLPEGEETTISNLLGDSNYTSKQLFDIHSYVNKVCRKLNIKLDFSGNQNKVGGLPYNLPLKKIKYELICPSCGDKLSFLMPDGNHLYCYACGKYYLNNDGNVGDETESPYNKKDVLY